MAVYMSWVDILMLNNGQIFSLQLKCFVLYSENDQTLSKILEHVELLLISEISEMLAWFEKWRQSCNKQTERCIIEV